MKNSDFDKSSFLFANDRLYQATLDEFSSKQFDYASLNDIIKNSDFNKGSFYYRFADKLDLYKALIALVFTDFSSIFNAKIIELPNRFDSNSIGIAFLESVQKLILLDIRKMKLLSRFEMEDSAIILSLRFDSLLSPLQSLHEFLGRCKTQNSSKKIESILCMTYRSIPSVIGNSTEMDSIATDFDQIMDFIHSIKDSSKLSMPIHGVERISIQSLNESLGNDSIISKGQLSILLGNIETNGQLFSDLRKSYPFDEEIEINNLRIFYGRWLLEDYLENQMKHDFSEREVLRFSRLIGLEGLLHSRIANLTLSERARLIILLNYLQNPDTLTIGPSLEMTIPEDSLYISRFILNIKRNGGKITLYGAKVSDYLPFADRVSFVLHNQILSTYDQTELTKKYSPDRFEITLSSQDGLYKRTIGKDQLHTLFIQPMLDGSELIGIRSIRYDSFTMYHLETGAELF